MTSRAEQIFFEVFEPLPRQGPGNLASAERALALCADLPASPRVLDLGCGSGAQRCAGSSGGSKRAIVARHHAAGARHE